MKEKKATQNEAAIKIVIRSKSLRGTTNSRLRVSPVGPLSPLQLVGTWFPLSSGRNTASDPHPPPPIRESNVVVRWPGASEESLFRALPDKLYITFRKRGQIWAAQRSAFCHARGLKCFDVQKDGAELRPVKPEGTHISSNSCKKNVHFHNKKAQLVMLLLISGA